MPILYVNFDEQYNCLKNNPYSEFAKKFNNFKENLNEKEIELRLGDGKNNGGFSDGFYTDGIYCDNPCLCFKFASVCSKEDQIDSTFTRMTYSFDYGDRDELDYHLKQIQALKLRIPFLYIPHISYFDFHFQIDENKLNWNFDVLTPNKDNILSVCFSLINLIISLFAFEE